MIHHILYNIKLHAVLFSFQAYYCMAECYEKMKQITRARVSLQVAFKLLNKEDAEWSSKIQEKMCSLAELNDETSTQDCTQGDNYVCV